MESSSVNSQVSPDPGPLPANKPKRARISEKKRQRARDLEQELLFLQAQYRFIEEPDLCELLQEAIVKSHRLGQATRQSDRDSVLKELETFEACETEELLEATGLSRWVLDEILGEFETKGLVEKNPSRDPVDGVGGRPRWVWSLIHTRP
jgi:hypothetical protein